MCPQTRWDKTIDAIGRLFRPILIIGVLILFYAAYADSINFIRFAKATKELPDMAWYTIYTIITSWVVGRGVTDIRRASARMGAVETDTSTEVEESPKLGRFDDDADHEIVHELPSQNSAIEAWRNAAR